MAQRSRAQRLNGLFPLSYTGVVPVSPPNFVMDDRAPTVNDSKNFYIGDIWLDQSASPITAANIWMLVGLAGNIATWVNFCCSTGSDEITIIGDTGSPITGISFIFSGGSTGLSFDGSGGNTMTLSFAGITANGGNVSLSTDAVADSVDIASGAANKIVTIGSTTASSTTKLQSFLGGMNFQGVAGVSVANKNYVTINSVTGEVGSDGGTTSSITITGNTGGAISSGTFTFTGGSTGLSFGGVGNTFTLHFAGITANGGTVSLATDATPSTVNIGTGAGAKTVTLGSTNTTSTTNLRAGSGGIKIPAFTEGALVTNSSGVSSSVTGLTGDVLTANGAGTAPSFQAIGTGSKVLIQRIQVTDVSTVDFVTGITGYSYYFLEALGYVCNFNNDVNFRTFFSSDGGASWGAYQYQQFNMGNNSHQATFFARNFGFNTAGNLWLGVQGPFAGATSYGTQYIYNLGNAGAVKKSIIDGANRTFGFNYAQQQRQVGATDSTAVVNGIRLTFGGGLALINSGDFRLYGIV